MSLHRHACYCVYLTLQHCSKIRETAKSLVDAPRLLSFLDIFRDNMWPGGRLKPPGVPRTPDEKARTMDEANRKLSSLFPGTPASYISNVLLISSFRPGCQYDWTIQRSPRCSPNFRCIAKPTIEPTYCLYHRRRSTWTTC